MYRNTFLLVIILAVFAALLVGVNIGKNFQKQTTAVIPTVIPTPTPQKTVKTYTNLFCGFSLSYPSDYSVLENASGSAILNNPNDSTQSITLTCQKEIPIPALEATKIEKITLRESSIAGTLYHESSPKDGTPIDVFIFRHPTNGMDGFVAGYGDVFTASIQTLHLLP